MSEKCVDSKDFAARIVDGFDIGVCKVAYIIDDCKTLVPVISKETITEINDNVLSLKAPGLRWRGTPMFFALLKRMLKYNIRGFESPLPIRVRQSLRKAQHYYCCVRELESAHMELEKALSIMKLS